MNFRNLERKGSIKKIILHNHETGCFFQEEATEDILRIVEQEIENGADMENLSIFIGERLRLKEYEVTLKKYGIERV